MGKRTKRDPKGTKILQLDAAGFPRSWLNVKDTIYALYSGKVQWSLGQIKTVFGGYSNEGVQSSIEVPAIIATTHVPRINDYKYAELNNRNLFRRDDYTCQYCGSIQDSSTKLSRDHIIPTSKGGRDVWTNVATSCIRCNHYKANKTPEQAGMQLIAVPYAPNVHEGFCLRHPSITDTQLEYLSKEFTSPRMFEKYSLAIA